MTNWLECQHGVKAYAFCEECGPVDMSLTVHDIIVVCVRTQLGFDEPNDKQEVSQDDLIACYKEIRTIVDLTLEDEFGVNRG